MRGRLASSNQACPQAFSGWWDRGYYGSAFGLALQEAAHGNGRLGTAEEGGRPERTRQSVDPGTDRLHRRAGRRDRTGEGQNCRQAGPSFGGCLAVQEALIRVRT